jgi:lipopolysaccharide biosynthesis glycosyltransferase
MSGVRERTEARPYFNAGVLVMDVSAWRRENVGERALRYVVGGSPLQWADQDSLNGVVEHMHELDARWNAQHSNFLPRNRHRSAAVWHFIGGKPWNPRSKTPGTYAWVWNLARSGWFSRVEVLKWLLFWLGARGWLNRAGEVRWPRLAKLLRRPLGRG